jgi:hypothetical protein
MFVERGNGLGKKVFKEGYFEFFASLTESGFGASFAMSKNVIEFALNRLLKRDISKSASLEKYNFLFRVKSVGRWRYFSGHWLASRKNFRKSANILFRMGIFLVNLRVKNSL